MILEGDCGILEHRIGLAFEEVMEYFLLTRERRNDGPGACQQMTQVSERWLAPAGVRQSLGRSHSPLLGSPGKVVLG